MPEIVWIATCGAACCGGLVLFASLKLEVARERRRTGLLEGRLRVLELRFEQPAGGLSKPPAPPPVATKPLSPELRLAAKLRRAAGRNSSSGPA